MIQEPLVSAPWDARIRATPWRRARGAAASAVMGSHAHPKVSSCCGYDGRLRPRASMPHPAVDFSLGARRRAAAPARILRQGHLGSATMSSSDVPAVTPLDAHAILQRDPRAVLLDVRTKMEFDYVGHPIGAVHV